MIPRYSALVLAAAVASFSSACDDPRDEGPCLTIHFEDVERRHCRAALLGRADVSEVTLDEQGFYRRVGRLEVEVVPLAPLLDFDFEPDAVLEAHGADGFSAPLDPSRLVAALPSGARAHLAIEPSDSPWPPLGEGRPSAGPFAIVWTGAGRGDVSAEEWPYQITSLRFTPPLSERYPALMPAAGVPETDPIREGLGVFVESCMPCHRLNDAGSAELGPDLNRPMSPVEYLTDDGLRRLIRDPASVRSWPASQMPATSEADVSDDELDALIAYLEHMAARR